MRSFAAVLRAPGRYCLEEVELPGPGPGQVAVRIVGAGMCHTDSLLRSMPTGLMPIIPGHEGAGVVEAVGEGVTRVAVGDHVVLSYAHCGSCRNCLVGHTAYCVDFVRLNLNVADGPGRRHAADRAGHVVNCGWFGQSSFATHAVASVENTVVVPRDVDLCLLGPLGCGIQTGAGAVLHTMGVRPGSSIAVLGAGAVGLAAVMAASLAGASQIIAVDVNATRRELGLSLGATDILGESTDGLTEMLLEIADGGLDYVLDTTGVPDVITAGLAAVRPTGVCGLVSAGSGRLDLDPRLLFGRHVVGIFEGGVVPQVFVPMLIEFWRAGRFPFDQLIARFDLSQVERAEVAMLRGEVVKPVLIPSH